MRVDGEDTVACHVNGERSVSAHRAHTQLAIGPSAHRLTHAVTAWLQVLHRDAAYLMRWSGVDEHHGHSTPMDEGEGTNGWLIRDRLDAHCAWTHIVHDLAEVPELLPAGERRAIEMEMEVLPAPAGAAQAVDRPIGRAADGQVIIQVVNLQPHELRLGCINALLPREAADLGHGILVVFPVPVVRENIHVLPYLRVVLRCLDVPPGHTGVDPIGELSSGRQAEGLHPGPQHFRHLCYDPRGEGVVVPRLVADGVVGGLDVVAVLEVEDEGQGMFGVLPRAVK